MLLLLVRLMNSGMADWTFSRGEYFAKYVGGKLQLLAAAKKSYDSNSMKNIHP